MVMHKLFIAAPLLPLLSGCVVGTIAKTAVDVATIPVKVASAGVDAATTSQSEADENRGREARKEDERRGHEARQMAERCRRGQPLPTDICAARQPR
jgi:hypothetical protein